MPTIGVYGVGQAGTDRRRQGQSHGASARGAEIGSGPLDGPQVFQHADVGARLGEQDPVGGQKPPGDFNHILRREAGLRGTPEEPQNVLHAVCAPRSPANPGRGGGVRERSIDFRSPLDPRRRTEGTRLRYPPRAASSQQGTGMFPRPMRHARVHAGEDHAVGPVEDPGLDDVPVECSRQDAGPARMRLGKNAPRLHRDQNRRSDRFDEIAQLPGRLGANDVRSRR